MAPKAKESKGLQIPRRFTEVGKNPLDQVEYTKRKTVIANTDGSAVFAMENVEVPASWSQLATDIIVSKYFRKRGVGGEGGETSARQVVHRLANTIRQAGEDLGGYFASSEDADTFESELAFYLIHQHGAFNSPVWFNVGLYHQYGIEGSGGNWYWNPATDKIEETANAYQHPQASACFIQSVHDDLMSIFDLAKNEARLFKYGSGTGTNFSRLRGKQEKLSGGGTSSGLMSFLEVLDKGAGATKSGGTTRRAAKMVSLDLDHPEILDFVRWKANEEKKVKALIDSGYSNDFNGEAYRTVSGQNSNNSVRVPDAFMDAYKNGGDWHTRMRTTDAVVDTIPARTMMHEIASAAWACADPGVQFDTTINTWHTCKTTDRIHGSNPCSEYMFLDDSACNLASLNLMKFYDEKTATFDIESYRHASRIFFIAQEILVDFASYPTKTIAQNSHDYRPLGLGYANLGTLLMVQGIPYDSGAGRAICAALTAILTGQAYAVSAEMAATKNPFPGFAKNRDSMLGVMQMHRDAAYAINEGECPSDLLAAAKADWDDAVERGERHGYRNAQATVIAPTGTIGLLMDCDTTGIEPDFALVKFKKLAGGGYFKIINQSIPQALKRLGYTDTQIHDIITYVKGTSTLVGSPEINVETLRARGVSDEALTLVESALPGVFDLRFAFNKHTLGDKGSTSLAQLGFTDAQIEIANRHICGTMTIEGAPHLKDVHLPVFDCANKCGKTGVRFLQPMAHATMMAAAQPFVSGAISKTINIPHESTVDEIEELYVESWRLGLKAVALYRDGSKMAQPLSSSTDESGGKKKEASAKESVEQPIELPRVAANAGAAQVAAPLTGKLARRRMPQKRNGITVEARVAGQKMYLRTGEYADGKLGEIFIDMHKEGATYRSIMNCFAIAVSLGLQYGVPLEEYVNMFTFTRFDPSGPVDHPNVKFATSPMDFIFRYLGMEYMGRTDLVQVPPEEVAAAEMRASEQHAADTAFAGGVAATMPTPAGNGAEKFAKATNGAATHGHGTNGHTHPLAKAIERAGGSLQANAATTLPHANHMHAPSVQDELPAVMVLKRGEGLAAAASHGLQSAGATATTSVMSEHLSTMMGDAPFCDSCGHVTVRNGSCYRCLNCGNSMGCS